MHFIQENRFKLIVGVVLEELNEDQVIWHLHKFKGFLADGTETDITPLNPIHLELDRSVLTEKGILKYIFTISYQLYKIFFS